MIFDSHAHFEDSRFDADRKEIFSSLSQYGVGYVMNVGSTPETSRKSVELAEAYPNVYAAVGSHPDDAGNFTDDTLETYRRLAQHPKVKAIGEIGLDYYYDDNPPEVQKDCFHRQMELASQLSLPVIIHDRDAHKDALEAIRAFPRVRGVFHCFSGSAEMARELVSLGWYVGFTGVLTFKNARRAVEAAAAVPADRILLETDCPYMAPEPHRGKRNDSRFLPYMVEKLAEIRNITREEAERITTENAKTLFQIP